VQIAVADTAVATELNPLLDEGSHEEARASSRTLRESQQIERQSTQQSTQQVEHGDAMDKGAAVRAALKAGVLGVFIGIIPLIGIVLTGALAVYLYRRANGVALHSAMGLRLGGAAGIVAFAINALFVTIRIVIFHAQQQSADDFIKVAQRFGLNVSDPDLQASIHNLFTPSGLVLTFFLGMILAVVLASIGGALASWVLRPTNPRG
jgi:hypothetical protein